MMAKAQRSRDAVGLHATRSAILPEPARSGRWVVVPDDGESVAGWVSTGTRSAVFWPARLDTLAQLDTARRLAEKLGANLGGSPHTSRAVFVALRGTEAQQ